MKINDLVTLPVVKTVVQLRDVRDPAESVRLVDLFVLTQEVRRGLQVILNSVVRGDGCGCFLKGHYGSGKSHFLSYLSLVLSNAEHLKGFLERFGAPTGPAALQPAALQPAPLQGGADVPPGMPERMQQQEGRPAVLSLRALERKRLAVVNLSLVEHRSAEHLEDIVGNAVHEFLHRETRSGDLESGRLPPGRSEAGDVGQTGAVEAEAVTNRGEEVGTGFSDSASATSWVAREKARLKAELRTEAEGEDTSSLLQKGQAATPPNRRKYFDAVFGELRRRGYDGLVLLVDELSEFLRSKPNPREFNEDVRYLQFLGELSSAAPLWIVAALQEHIEETGEINQEVFNKIKDRYPVRLALTAQHVKTLVKELIVQKKPGAVEPIKALYRTFRSSFPELAVPEDEFIDLYPVHASSIDLLELLKPLFSKTRGFVDFVHYQIRGDSSRGIPGLLEEPTDTLLCPDRIFDHFLDRLQSTVELVPYLETVYAHYVKEAPRILPDPDDQRYALRLIKLLILQDICPVRQEFSIRQIAEMLLERITDIDPLANYAYTSGIAEQLLNKGGYLTRKPGAGTGDFGETYHIELQADVGPVVDRKLEYKRESLRPLGRQVEARLFEHLVPRSSFFSEAAGSQPISVEWQNTRRSGLVRFARPESDPSDLLLGGGQTPEFLLILLLPGQTPEDALRVAADSACPCAILQPAPLQDAERCLTALALFELLRETRDDEASQTRRVRDRLASLLDDQLPVVLELFQRRFEQAQLLSEHGEIMYAFQPTGRARAQQLFEEAAARVLEFRFPQHYLIAPQHNFYPQGALDELARFFQSMTIEAFEQMRWGRTVLDGFLLPLGIVRRTRKEYSFAPNHGDCKPLQLLLQTLEQGERLSAGQAERVLAECAFGMSELQFKPFLMAALFAGFLVEYRGGRKVSLQGFQPARLMEIQELRPGQTVSAEALRVLQSLDLIPKKFQKPALSYPECQQCWDALKAAVVDLDQKRREVEQFSERYSQYRVFRQLKLDPLQTALEEVSGIVKAARMTYSPIEGLEAFAASIAVPEKANQAAKALADWHGFLAEDFTALVFMGGYLESAEETVKGRAELEQPVHRLITQLRDLDPANEQGGFRILKSEFENWMQGYTAVYQREHDRFYTSEAFESLAGVLDSPGLKLLGRLQSLKFFIPDRPAASITERLRSELQKRCRRSVWEELQQRPVCGCGFRLALRPDPPPVGRFESEIKNLLAQFVRQVQHPRVQELLDRFEFQAGRQAEETPDRPARLPGQGVRTLKRIASVDQLLEAAPQLSTDLMERLNRFEPDKQPFQVKRLAEFLAQAGAEPKPPRVLASSFAQWVSGGLSDADQPVRLVLSAEAGQPDQAPPLRSLVLNRAPELQADLERFTTEEFLFRLLSAELIGRYDLSPAAVAANLPLAPLPEQIGSYRRLTHEVAERFPVKEAIESLESRIGENEYRSLGILTDSPTSLAKLLADENFFPGLSRLALRSLLKGLAHAEERTIVKAGRALHDDWKPAAHSSFTAERDQQKGLLDSVLWIGEVCTRAGEMAANATSRAPDPPRLSKATEKFYCEVACLAPYMLDRLELIGDQLGLAASIDFASFRRRVETALGDFFDRYEKEIESAAENLPRVEKAVKSGVGRLTVGRRIKGMRVVFVDALAWPLWKLLLPRLTRSLPPGVTVLDSGPVYSRQPSVTQEQVQKWIEAELIEDKGATLPGRLPLLQDRGDEKTYTIDWIDTKLHGSRESPYLLYEEILDQLEPQLVSTLRSFRKNTLVVLISDHGFRENPAFDKRDKFRAPRYTHGGSSPFEVVAPVAFFLV